MFEIPQSKTQNIHEHIWDSYGSFQGTYFEDTIKKRIKFFLGQRLNGRNIEIGGGWYLSYSNSTVVDLSGVCLQHNPAKEKLQFDLDEIEKGRRLPYSDASFDSATLISVWQYLRHPKKVIKELERILKPGAEIYLINGQGAGLSECIVGVANSAGIEIFFRDLGYDTLVEDIPDYIHRVGEFKSVCVAMLDKDLFDKKSRIKNKTQRQKRNQDICENPQLFTEDYRDFEARRISVSFAKLSRFPITVYSREFLADVENFSREYYSQTGKIPLVFIEHAIESELSLLVPDNSFSVGLAFIGEKNIGGDHSFQDKLSKKYKCNFIFYSTYFHPATTVSELTERCAAFELEKGSYFGGSGNGSELERYTRFISAIALNSYTRDLQSKVLGVLKPKVEDLEERLKKEKAHTYFYLGNETKQRRRIDDLISAKYQIENEGIPIVGTSEFDYIPYLQDVRNLIE